MTDTSTFTSTGLANQSCRRCHGRKKKCNRNLPKCKACVQANVECSFEEAGTETGIFQVSYIRALERRVHQLESELKLYQTGSSASGGRDYATIQTFATNSPGNTSFRQAGMPSSDATDSASSSQYQNDAWSTGSLPGRYQQEISGEKSQQNEIPESLESGLKYLSLEATADRYLGSSSGVTFARLTQAVLKRLKPDQQLFTSQIPAAHNDPSTPTGSSPLSDEQNSFHPDGLTKDVSISLIPVADMPLPNKTHAYQLAEYYWSHSHTLYPFVRKALFMESLEKMYANPDDSVLRSSHSWLYTMWMIFAIGSTSLSSVMISDETESIQYWKAAMFHFDATLEAGNMAALNGILLQVSYSWFNQIGPNTWYLVGMAIRLALGMGLHTYPAKTRAPLPRHVQEYRARIFFSLYMMDRLVSVTLGRPFGIRDEDIEIEPFTAADDDSILPDRILPHTGLSLPSMSVPLHILALRKIAGEIFQEIYSNKKSSPANDTASTDTIIRNLHEKLILWRRNMPFPLPESQNLRVPHLSTAWYDLNYHNHVIMLYRPSPLCPIITIEKVAILADASAMSLRHATTMHRQQRLAFNWLNLLAVFTTALTLIYTITAQPEQIRDYLNRSNALEDLKLAAMLLGTFAQKFRNAKKYRDMVLGVIVKLEAQLHGQETRMTSTPANGSASLSPSNSNPSPNIDSSSQHKQPQKVSSEFDLALNLFHQQHILGLSSSPQETNFPSTEDILSLDALSAQDLVFDFSGGGVNGATGMNAGVMDLDEEFMNYLDPGSRYRGMDMEHEGL